MILWQHLTTHLMEKSFMKTISLCNVLYIDIKLTSIFYTIVYCCISPSENCTRWFKYDRDKLWLVYTQIVPVIFEPPCILKQPTWCRYKHFFTFLEYTFLIYKDLVWLRKTILSVNFSTLHVAVEIRLPLQCSSLKDHAAVPSFREQVFFARVVVL
jgi:hypothetical protein